MFLFAQTEIEKPVLPAPPSLPSILCVAVPPLDVASREIQRRFFSRD